MPDKVTNETLAYMLRAQKETGDERHEDNVKRLDQIHTEVKTTNGRLQKVEQRQAVDLKRFEHIDGRFEQIDDVLARRADRLKAPKREIVLRFGWAGIGAAAIPFLQLLWKALHG